MPYADLIDKWQNDLDRRTQRRSDPILAGLYREQKREWDRADRAKNLQRRLKDRLTKRMHCYLRGSRSMRTYELLGCDHATLVIHLLKPFSVGADLFILLKTHQIDHIEPCASFDLSKPMEQLKCFHYTNLQLLPSAENARKWIW